MKLITLAVLVFAMVSCNSGTQNDTQEKKSKKIVETNQSDSDGGIQESDIEEVGEESRTPLSTDGKLFCKALKTDEYGVPHSEVSVSFNSEREKVANCLSCDIIPKSDYAQYDIPKNAKSACGGWFAGGGDYFYSLVKEDGTVEVYSGWQDEGQMEDNDTSFHWELRKKLK